MENLGKDIQMRTETDRMVSTLWIILPVVVLALFLATILVTIIAFTSAVYELPGGFSNVTLRPAAGVLAGLLALGGALWVASVVVSIVFIYLTYVLIKRRNKHFARQQRFYEDLVAVLKEMAARRGVNIDVSLGNMDRTVRDMKMDEGEKSAVLWAILTIIPVIEIVASLYILYFLTKDYFKHERREDALLEDVARSLTAMNISFDNRRTDAVPERSYLLYIILTIVTVGLFGIYWWYALIKDPNIHFKSQVIFEDTLLNILSTAT